MRWLTFFGFWVPILGAIAVIGFPLVLAFGKRNTWKPSPSRS